MKSQLKILTLVLILVSFSCTQQELIEQPIALSDIINGKWNYTAYMGWPKVPDDIWHPAEADNILLISFNEDGSLLFNYERDGVQKTGNYEVIDSSNTIIMELPDFINLPFEFRISSFTPDEFIKSYSTDEGSVSERYERIE